MFYPKYLPLPSPECFICRTKCIYAELQNLQFCITLIISVGSYVKISTNTELANNEPLF